MKSQFPEFVVSLLALLGSSAGMAATVTIVPSTLTPEVGDTFTLTIQGDVGNTFAATMALEFDATKVAFVSGEAVSPFNVFVKNSPVTANPTVFDIEAPTATAASPGTYSSAMLTFTALASGDANILINDDGGSVTGWFDADTADYIPVTYTQASVTVAAPGAPNVVVTDSVVPDADHQVPFGQVTEGTTSATQRVTVTNSGTADLAVGPVALANALLPPFSVVSDTCSGTLVPDASCFVDIDFSPVSTGDFEDGFDIPTSDPDEPSIVVAVSGTGTPMPVPNIVVTDAIAPNTDHQVAFGSVVQNQASTQTLTVSNNGTADLVLGLIATADPLVAPFSIVIAGDGCSGQILAPAGSCTFQIEFLPTTVGAFDNTLDIPSDDPDSPTVTVAVSGTGAPVPVADIEVTDSASPAADLLLEFGDVRLPNSAEETVTVANDGTAELVIGSVASANAIAAPFSIVTDNCSGQTIEPAGTCTITVAFDPGAVQSFNESFDIPSNDPDETSVTVAVSGSGMPERTSGGGGSALDPATLLALGLIGIAARRRVAARPQAPSGTSA